MPLPWAAHPACSVWRQECQENRKHRPNEGGMRSHPLKAACSRFCLPAPCSRRGLLPAVGAVKGGPQGIFEIHLCLTHFSETQRGGFQGEAWGQGGRGRMLVWRCLPVAAREGWHGDSPLPVEEVWAPLGHRARRGR